MVAVPAPGPLAEAAEVAAALISRPKEEMAGRWNDGEAMITGNS